MIRGGVGGGKTKVGLKFESRVDIRKVFEKAPHYAVKENVVYFNDQKVAQLFQKHKLYKDLLEKNGIDYSTLISKKLLPGDAVLVLGNKTLFIVEIKFQEVADRLMKITNLRFQVSPI